MGKPDSSFRILGDDGQLIDAYVAAIQRLYHDWERTKSWLTLQER